jgi:DNA (cytosine-5)-methyltransferase 1
VKYLEKSFSKEDEAKHRIRKLTPIEAFRLQGFDDKFVHNAQLVGISNHQLYKQAGNAVSVNTVYSILYSLFQTKQIQL